MPAAAGAAQDRARAGARARREGATRLRRTRRRQAAAGIWSGLAVAAATLVAILFVAPMIKEADATVSAAEILAKSASRLSRERSRPASRSLEYELVLDGVPNDMMPDHADGTYRVKQVIDHDVPGRFRFASYGADGRLMSSIAQDPASGRRVMTIRSRRAAVPVRGHVCRRSRCRCRSPEMERLHMEASIAMMQASGNQLLEVIDTTARAAVPHRRAARRRRVHARTRVGSDEAHVLIDASDYHIVEFAVKGTFLKQPYSVSYRLIARDVVAAGRVAAGDVRGAGTRPARS